jgi:hypothetical protein
MRKHLNSKKHFLKMSLIAAALDEINMFDVARIARDFGNRV